MTLNSLLSRLQNTTLIDEILDRATRDQKLTIQGGCRTAKTLISAGLAKSANTNLLVILPTLEEATRWHSQLQLMGWDKTFLYPGSEVTPYESINQSTEISWGQLSIVSELACNKSINFAVICTERSLFNHLPHPKVVNENSLLIKRGQDLNVDNINHKLTEIGYERNATTNQEGYWSRRGDIIDIYAVNNELPIRIELFGDKVDKLREYDPITQRSLDEIDEIVITPISFNYLLTESLENYKKKNTNLNKGYEIENMILERALLSSKYQSSILDFLNTNTLVILDEKNQCKEHTDNWLYHLHNTYSEMENILKKKNVEIELQQPIRDSKIIYECLSKFVTIETYSDKQDNTTNNFNLSSKIVSTYPNQFSKISELIKTYTKEDYSIWILSAQPSRAKALLQEHDCSTHFIPNNHDLISILNLIKQKIPVALKLAGNIDIEGLDLPQWKIVLLTDKELFGQQLISSTGYIRRRNVSSSNKVELNKINPGDYVVHRNHGVGKFLRIEKFFINKEARDYLLVQYLDGTLRVSADQLSSLGRYRSSNNNSPKISKLGGNTWKITKQKAKKAINKVAIDLIKLYAERSNSQGFCFPEDGPWQSELEDSFPYVATPDQVKAVTEIKKDMENHIPMDRLICGDVGFGKTEVAVRALFKAITAGKQVAVLAPTTVLAQQHWRTLSDRFAPYPIKVSLLNRFKSLKERKEIINELEKGKIDAIIGTHLLLSNKIKYKDLGLLVIDEEQRFGVTQKEKIKSLKKHIDVITLTATPIPRTLYMSLSGVREMSLITTPPPQRRAIKTHLAPIDDETIRSAICQEIGRGGQVFYVVPKIEGIEKVTQKIQSMVPKINIIIAHGQMDEGELEIAMIAFNEGEADLMICTTIIESGLDIPRVNTILIENAHLFGLSQLYQLRGRVGRSGIQAHAWLFYPPELKINEKARQRLKAIKEFSELGSGYQLAMRDMEIRGVGNLIGVEQSGQMEAIGFDLYMEILHESIADIQGQSIPTVEETKIDLPITAFIPGTWISENEEKINAYKEASECETSEQLIDLTTTWIDRFGALPKPVEALLLLMKLKLRTKKLGISRVRSIKPNIVLDTSMNHASFKSLVEGLDKHLQGRVIFKKGQAISEITLRGLGTLAIEHQIETIIEWLDKMSAKLPNIEKEIGKKLSNKLSP